jgi:hypothetical protein
MSPTGLPFTHIHTKLTEDRSSHVLHGAHGLHHDLVSTSSFSQQYFVSKRASCSQAWCDNDIGRTGEDGLDDEPSAEEGSSDWEHEADEWPDYSYDRSWQSGGRRRLSLSSDAMVQHHDSSHTLMHPHNRHNMLLPMSALLTLGPKQIHSRNLSDSGMNPARNANNSFSPENE